ncbi:DUF2164 domain-containing protein [Rhizobium sp. RU36D]|uniref:DUF2164 domain-containing protein n=1 Tax=Rhizobium sp. RU36D TaxID=1907415 RepID=UPI0009D85E39|nr:DUF2164 domain-containing protein [Rhizobium sp. RU36D]SMC58731.1 Uncharacterized conserved protein, DUF2164 family [Rhizobium sp. RU36D]
MLSDFTKEEMADLIDRARAFLQMEFDLTAGRFEVEALIAFFAEEVGVRAYNKGLADAQAVLMAKVDDINDAIYQLERQPKS